MIKSISTFLLCTILVFSMANAKSLWKTVTPEYIYSKIKCFKDDKIALNTFSSLSLNYSKLLKKANQPTAVINVPYPDGSLHAFKLTQSNTMSEALAKQFPNIKSFSAVSVENAAVTGRFDFNDTGFHGLIRELNDQIVIEPFCSTSRQYYISFWKSSYKSTRPADMK
jgi:hypothetical protein